MLDNNYNRAVQFLPFDSLKGFKEALRKKEKIVEKKKILSEDKYTLLNNKLNKLSIGMIVRIKYYYNLEYIEVIGMIKKIDDIYKRVFIDDMFILFEDIVDIDLVK